MKTIYLILLSWVCLCTSVSAEPLAHKASLQGKVTDAVDGSPVVGASIYFPLLKQGTVTNEEGFYRIDDLPAVKTMIQVSYVGHLTIIETIDLRTVHEQDFMLQENNAMLKEVVVTGLTFPCSSFRCGTIYSAEHLIHQYHRRCRPSAGSRPDHHRLGNLQTRHPWTGL